MRVLDLADIVHATIDRITGSSGPDRKVSLGRLIRETGIDADIVEYALYERRDLIPSFEGGEVLWLAA